ncbi:MAG: serine/threonine protein kinase [Planctomycetota bacterium]|nr:serine/threonine protein kinase [Planctomycetota bacterium]
MTVSVGGTRIGDYELLAKLGEGGMGAVYLAQQKHLDRKVALKVLSAKLVDNPEYIGRFLREARATARLNHPNIVSGIDINYADGCYYFAMEYVEGETLKAKILRDGALPETEAVRIGTAIASALSHAHAAGLVHRDVKPDNILIDLEGTPKLADLGLAKGAYEDSSLTKSGFAVGTPHYMAPEQVRGERNLDGRADAYALGCTLYHASTGKLPFETAGASAPVVMLKHLNERLPHPQALVPALSDGFCAVLTRLLARDREERYENLREAAEDLESLAAGLAPARAALPAARSVLEPSPRAKAGRGKGRDRVPSEKAALPVPRTRGPERRISTAGPRRSVRSAAFLPLAALGFGLVGLALFLGLQIAPLDTRKFAPKPGSTETPREPRITAKTEDPAKAPPARPAPRPVDAAPPAGAIIRDPASTALVDDPLQRNSEPVQAANGSAPASWRPMLQGPELEGWERIESTLEVREGAVSLKGAGEIQYRIPEADFEVRGQLFLAQPDDSRWKHVGGIGLRRPGGARGTGVRLTLHWDGDIHLLENREQSAAKTGAGALPVRTWTPFTLRAEGGEIALRIGEAEEGLRVNTSIRDAGNFAIYAHTRDSASELGVKDLEWRPLRSR